MFYPLAITRSHVCLLPQKPAVFSGTRRQERSPCIQARLNRFILNPQRSGARLCPAFWNALRTGGMAINSKTPRAPLAANARHPRERV